MKTLNFSLVNREPVGSAVLNYEEFINPKSIVIYGIGDKSALKLKEVKQNILVQTIVRFTRCGFNVQLQNFPQKSDHTNFDKLVRSGRKGGSKNNYKLECLGGSRK